MTKVYVVTGCAKDTIKNSIRPNIEYVQPFGSVTEVCKFLKVHYNFPEKDSRKLIITAFGQNTKLWIQVPDGQSVRISQHKVDIESRIHGESD